MDKETAPLSEVRTHFFEEMKEGTHCPCCGRWAQVYVRTINYNMADSLIGLYKITLKQPETEFFHTKQFTRGHDGSDFGKCKHWGLIEQMPKNEDHKGRVSGFWKITQAGIDFVEKKTRLNALLIYDDRVIKMDLTKSFNIKESLKDFFDYEELMKGI